MVILKLCMIIPRLQKTNRGAEIVILLVYVDDLLITINSESLINEVKLSLQTSFRMKDLNDLKYFLCIEVARAYEGLVLC